MISAIIAAAAVGIVQVILDIVVFAAVLSKKASKGVASVLIKFVLYGAAFYLLFKLFRALVKAAVIGFAIGFFPCLFIYCAYKIKKVK